MGLLCEFDVCGDFGFLEQTNEFGIVPDYSEGCQVFCETFLRVSRRLVPVDTGYLRSTLDAGGGDTYCYAETDCEYAQYVEYGTWKQSAQPYFEPAIEAALQEAEPLWIQAEEDALMEEQMLLEEAAEEEAAEMAMMGASLDSSSSIGSMAGAFLGSLISALIITFVREIFAVDTGPSYNIDDGGSRRGFSGGRGSVFMPDIDIT